MKIIFGYATTAGIREENQDSVLAMLGNKMSLFAIADGAGGHAYGKEAGNMAIEAIASEFNECDSYDIEYLVGLIKLKYNQINEYILVAQEKMKALMGTTLSMINLVNDKVIISNVGDTKIFRINKDSIDTISEVHTLAWDSYRKGQINIEDIDNHPQKHVLSRALGIRGSLEPYINVFDYTPGDYYIICSDGVYNFVAPNVILQRVLNAIVHDNHDMTYLCQSIITKALQNGSDDNASILMLKCNNEI